MLFAGFWSRTIKKRFAWIGYKKGQDNLDDLVIHLFRGLDS
jgi:hypothetical protein